MSEIPKQQQKKAGAVLALRYHRTLTRNKGKKSTMQALSCLGPHVPPCKNPTARLRPATPWLRLPILVSKIHAVFLLLEVQSIPVVIVQKVVGI